MTTVHIPFFLDGNASRTYRGQPYIDGRCAPGCCLLAGAACDLRLHSSCLHTCCLTSMPSFIPPARSLWDFLLGDNSALIKCNDEACVVDYVSAPLPACCPADGQGMELALAPSPVRFESSYRAAQLPPVLKLPARLPPACPGPQFNDDQLKWGRLDFIKLADLEQVQAFVQAGTDYAERTDAGSECSSRRWGVSLQCQRPC